MNLCGNGAALTERSGRRCHVRTDNYQAQPDEMGMASVRQQGKCPKAGVRKKSQGRQVQRRARAVSSIGRAGIALTIKLPLAAANSLVRSGRHIGSPDISGHWRRCLPPFVCRHARAAARLSMTRPQRPADNNQLLAAIVAALPRCRDRAGNV